MPLTADYHGDIVGNTTFTNFVWKAKNKRDMLSDTVPEWLRNLCSVRKWIRVTMQYHRNITLFLMLWTMQWSSQKNTVEQRQHSRKQNQYPGPNATVGIRHSKETFTCRILGLRTILTALCICQFVFILILKDGKSFNLTLSALKIAVLNYQFSLSSCFKVQWWQIMTGFKLAFLGCVLDMTCLCQRDSLFLEGSSVFSVIPLQYFLDMGLLPTPNLIIWTVMTMYHSVYWIYYDKWTPPMTYADIFYLTGTLW